MQIEKNAARESMYKQNHGFKYLAITTQQPGNIDLSVNTLSTRTTENMSNC